MNIQTRDDLSFTRRDTEGRLINWPTNNPGVSADWAKGVAYFEKEVADLAENNETGAFHAIEFAITGMGGHYTCLEFGFAEAIARAAILGLRTMRGGAEKFEPSNFGGE